MTAAVEGPVSILVPTVGRIDLLAACVASVLVSARAGDEVVVVDQSPGEDVATLVAGLGDARLRRLACDGRGTARAMNFGLRAVAHDTVLVTHDDCTVDPGWVTAAVGSYTAAPAGAIVTGRVLAPRDAAYVPSTKDDPHPRDHTGETTSGLLYPANMITSRAALLDIGGFDERPGLRVSEDNDLCYRWLVDGRPFLYDPALVVWHHDWRTPEQLVRTHIAYARSQGAFYGKHLHGGDRRVLAMLRWDLRKGLRSTARGLVRRTQRWEDPYREMVVPLLVGVAAGWIEDRRLRRAQDRSATGSG